jgi:endonuclease III
MIQTLREFYGLQAMPPADLFQFFVWEIISEQALPARRDLAWQQLRRIPALTPDALFRVPVKELLDAVGVAGPHREDKVERLRAITGEFRRHRDILSVEALSHAHMVAAVRALRRLDQVPRTVRARAILFAVGALVLPIDPEINRVVGRLMGTPTNRRRSAARRWLAERVPLDLPHYREAVIYLRHHALHTCLTVGPHCGVCPLRHTCGSVQRSDAAT